MSVLEILVTDLLQSKYSEHKIYDFSFTDIILRAGSIVVSRKIVFFSAFNFTNLFLSLYNKTRKKKITIYLTENIASCDCTF